MTRPIINHNGTVRPATDSELAEMERLAELERLAEQTPKPEPTPEERLAALEKALAERDALILELLSKNN